MNEVEERFKYELKSWLPKLGSKPVEILETEDYSRGYDVELMHVFRLEDGTMQQ